MMLGRAEKAGSGVDKMVAGWKKLGWDTPVISEEVQPDFVVLTLPIGSKETQEESTKPHKEAPQENADFYRKIYKKERNILRIVTFCKEPKSAVEIKEHFRLSDRKNLKKRYIDPRIANGLLVMTEPTFPQSRNQKYKSTGE